MVKDNIWQWSGIVGDGRKSQIREKNNNENIL